MEQHHIIPIDSSRKRGQLPVEQHHIILVWDSNRRRGELYTYMYVAAPHHMDSTYGAAPYRTFGQQQIKQKDEQQIEL